MTCLDRAFVAEQGAGLAAGHGQSCLQRCLLSLDQWR
jgi:hypothetical protein